MRKSLTINDLRRLGRRKPLIIKDLRGGPLPLAFELLVGEHREVGQLLASEPAELGTLAKDNSYTLSSYEVASELSYFIWGTMPDEELFAAESAAL